MLDVENNIIYHSGVTDGAKCSINPVREIDVKETNNIIIVIYNFLLNDYGSWQKVMDGEAKGLKGEDGGDLWWDLSIITKNKKIIRYRDYTFNKDNLNLFTE